MNNEWTRDQREKLTEAITALCGFFNKDMPDIAFRMYAKLLMEHPFDSVMDAVQRVLRDPSVRAMPTPAQVMATVHPPISPAADARDVATILFATCRKKGDFWNAGTFVNGQLYFEGKGQFWPTFEEALMAEVGEVGFAVVKRYGGWGAFWSVYNLSPDGVFLAQVRDLAETLEYKAMGGTLHHLPKLPRNREQVELERRQLLMSQMKKLEGGTDDAS